MLGSCRRRQPVLTGYLLALLIFTGFSPAEASGPEPQAAFRFDISAGPLDGVLAAFERATGMVVSIAPALQATASSIYSPGVAGT